MEILAPQEFDAVKKFANGLTETFTNKMLSSKEPFEKIVLDYVVKVIDIRLNLERIKVEMYLNEMAGAYGK